MFNQLSVELQDAYSALEAKVESLDAALRDALDDRERQRAQKEQIAERMAGLLVELPVGVVVVGDDGVIEQANRAACEMLATPLVGVRWATVAATVTFDSSRNDCVRSDAQTVAHGAAGLRLTMTERRMANAGRVLVLTDVSEVYELEQELARNQRLAAMGELGARLAHQIRTPVTSAMLYASNLTSTGPEAAKPAARKIYDRLNHIEFTVNDMLAFAKGDGGDLREACMASVVADSVEKLHPKVAERVVVALPPGIGSIAIVVNVERLSDAIVNLVANAVESGASRAVIGTRETTHGLEITVTDDGPGIPPALRERIFDPFFTTRDEGTGLGLAVAKAGVASMGGLLYLDGGAAATTFAVRLPIAHEADPAVAGRCS